MNNLFTVLLCVFSFAACSQNSVVKNIDNKTFSEKMNAANTIVLDVRTPEEYGSGHIPNAKLINIYDPEFSKKLDALDKSKTYLVYCQKGGRSLKASEQMQQKGFKEIYNLEKGFSNWNGAVEK